MLRSARSARLEAPVAASASLRRPGMTRRLVLTSARAPSLPGSALRPQLRSLARTCRALATHGLDEGCEIITAVMIRDFLTGFDVLDCPDPDLMPHEIDFRVRPAGVIDVARLVAAARAVDGPARVDLEQIARIELIGGFGADFPAAVTHDELSFADRHTRKQPEARPCSP